jgi:predicted RNase H-like HicB family nuclease
MNKSIDYYMSLSYKIEIVKDDAEGGYALQHPELRGCITCADTIGEGLEMLEDAKRSWIEACIEDNIEIPEPSNVGNYSGQFKLRIPKSLHMRLAEVSKAEGVSMNQYCLHLLSSGVGAPRGAAS